MLAVQGKPFKAGGGAYACGWTASSSQPSRSMTSLALSMGSSQPSSGRTWTPPTEQRTRMAPSKTLSARSTSMVKSTWPGRVDDVD